MSVELIPTGTSAVITERHEEREPRQTHPDRYDITRQAEINHQGVVRQADENRHSLSRQADADRHSLEVQAGVIGTAGALAASRTDHEMATGFSFAQKQVSDAATSTLVGFKDGAVTAYQLQGQGLLEAAKNAAAISVQNQRESDGLSGQATANFNLSSVQSESHFQAGMVKVDLVQYNILLDAQKNFQASQVQANLMQYNILLDSQKNAAAALLSAERIAAVAAAKAAECCCELKTAIIFDGQKTRDLLNSQKEQDLRDRAQRAENAVSAYFAAKVAPVSPIS
jgi:hypothetical protein